MNIKNEFELLTVHLFTSSKLVCSSIFKALLLRWGEPKPASVVLVLPILHRPETRSGGRRLAGVVNFADLAHSPSGRIVFQQSSSHFYWCSEKRIWASELDFFTSIILMSWRANKAPSLLHILCLGITSLCLQRFETTILIFPMSRVCVYTKTSSRVHFTSSGH